MQDENKRLMILIWDMGIGGVQKRVRDILLDIEKNHTDWEVHLLIKFKRPGYFEDEIRSFTKTKIHFYPHYRSYSKSKSPSALLWIIRKYYGINPHVCLTFLDHLSIIMVFTKFLLFWRNTKLVLNEGILTSDYLKIYRKKIWLWTALIKSTYKYADRIIVPTKAVKTNLASHFSVPKEKITVVPNWTLFKPLKPIKPVYDLIFIGRFENEKNPLAIIEIIKKIRISKKDVILRMLGSGSLERKIRSEIRVNKLSKNIKIDGFIDNIVPYLRSSKLLILPTINEGMPNVVLEAAVYKVPTVTTSFPGVKEVIIHRKTGFIANNLTELSSYIMKLLEDENLRKSLGNGAYYHVEKNFSYQNQKKFISSLLSL